MNKYDTSPLGKLRSPEFSRVTFLPGRTAGRGPGHTSLVRVVAYDGTTGHPTQAAWGFGLVPIDGYRRQWYESYELQQLYKTSDDYVNSFNKRFQLLAKYPYAQAWSNNERVDNGGKMAEKLLYNVASPNHTPSFPTRMALCNLNTFAAAHGDLSIGSATPDVTTNEFTNHGLARTTALTPTNTDPSALDGQYIITISNSYTETAGPDSVYGTALFDAAVGTSNMYCESTFSVVTLQTNDIVAVTWTNKG